MSHKKLELTPEQRKQLLPDAIEFAKANDQEYLIVAIEFLVMEYLAGDDWSERWPSAVRRFWRAFEAKLQIQQPGEK